MGRIARLAERLRKEGPIVGRAPNADGVVDRVKVGIGGLIYIVTGSAYSFTTYRELDAAIRAALRPRPYYCPSCEWLARPITKEAPGRFVSIPKDFMWPLPATTIPSRTI